MTPLYYTTLSLVKETGIAGVNFKHLLDNIWDLEGVSSLMKSDRRISTAILLTLSISLVVLASTHLAEESREGSIDLGVRINGYRLDKLWDRIVYSIGVDNTSARLIRLEIKVNSSGVIEYISLEFYTTSNGEWYYQVSIRDEKLWWISSRLKEDLSTYQLHPREALKVINDIGIHELGCLIHDARRNGYIIVVENTRTSEIMYESTLTTRIVLWYNGLFIPVDRVFIKDHRGVYVINVIAMYSDVIDIDSGNRMLYCTRKPVCINCLNVMVVPGTGFYEVVEVQFIK